MTILQQVMYLLLGTEPTAAGGGNTTRHLTDATAIADLLSPFCVRSTGEETIIGPLEAQYRRVAAQPEGGLAIRSFLHINGKDYKMVHRLSWTNDAGPYAFFVFETGTTDNKCIQPRTYTKGYYAPANTNGHLFLKQNGFNIKTPPDSCLVVIQEEGL